MGKATALAPCGKDQITIFANLKSYGVGIPGARLPPNAYYPKSHHVTRNI